MNTRKDRSHLFRKSTRPFRELEGASGSESSRNNCLGRGYHTSLLFKDNIVTFGGEYNCDQADAASIGIYDVKDDTWSHVETNLPPRFGHTACAFENNKIIIYGGQSCDESMEGKPINTLVIGVGMNKNQQGVQLEWISLENNPGECLQRYCHTAHVIQDQMYVFGGLDRANHSTNHIWCLNLNTFIWFECPTMNNPLDERWGHSSVIFHHMIYLFGGYSDTKRAYMNDLWTLNLETMVWQQSQVKELAVVPSARRGHSMVVENNKIYCFGGETQDGVYSDELFSLDLECGQWESIPVKDLSLDPRAYQTMMMYDDNILIFGGRSQNGYLSDFQLIPTDGCGCARDAFYSEFEEFSGGHPNYSAPQAQPSADRLSMREQTLLLDAGVNLENINYNSSKGIFLGNFFDSIQPALVHFMEGKGLNFSLVQPLELLKLSFQFNLYELRKTCEVFLINNLTELNYVEVAKAAEAFEMIGLKNAVSEFVINNISRIRPRDDLHHLPKESLIDILLRFSEENL